MRVADVPCVFCGGLCDDLVIDVENNVVRKVVHGCALSQGKFLNHEMNASFPAIRKDGELVRVTLDEAIGEAADILRSAQYPLVYGLSNTETGAIRKCVELAEICGATIDSTSSVCHGPTSLAVHSVGSVRASLGEVKNRADFLIFWGCNPAEAHPRHYTRYSVNPEGLFRRQRRERFLTVVDIRETPSNARADMSLVVDQGHDFELLSALRASIKGYGISDTAGIRKQDIEMLAQKMKTCRFGVFFWGLGLTMTSGKDKNIEAAASLVRDLNEYTKFVMTPMRGHFNVTGAGAVLLWQTGYPNSVNFSRGYPVYNPGEFSVSDVLARKEPDCALIVASDPISHLPRAAAEHLARIPTIIIDPKITMTSLIAKVQIPSATAGISAEGSAYRMDGLALRLKKLVSCEYPSDAEILQKIINGVRG